MNAVHSFKLSGVAVPGSAADMLDEICEHFVEHAEVERRDDLAVLQSELGVARISIENGRLLIELDCPTREKLHMSRTILAEHLFYFAEGQPFELTWSEPTSLSVLPNLHEVTVVSAHDVTPHMRRVIFSCADVTPFVGSDMHVRLLVPPKGKPPVWPGYRKTAASPGRKARTSFWFVSIPSAPSIWIGASCRSISCSIPLLAYRLRVQTLRAMRSMETWPPC